MASRASMDRSWVEDLERAGWSRLADRLIHGICHSLNGRITALSSVLYFLESPGHDPPSMASLLEPELKRLQEAERFLRLLPDDRTGPRPLAPGEVLPFLSRSLTLQRGLEGVKVDLRLPPDTPGVRVDQALFVRSMLLLLSHLAEVAVSSGGDRVQVTTEDEEGRMRLSFQIPEEKPSPGERTSPRGPPIPFGPLPEDCQDNVARALGKEGIELAGKEDGQDREGEEKGGIRLEVSFPPPC